VPAALPFTTSHQVLKQTGVTVNMRGKFSGKLTLLILAVLVIGCGSIGDAAASSVDAEAAAPDQTMSAHLWINGLPDGQIVTVLLPGHAQLSYYGGEGRYDFSIAGQQGETIQVLADGREVQGFAFEPGAPVCLCLEYADGMVSSLPYDPGMPMPTPYALSTIAPEPQTEHTSLSLGGSWILVIATMMSLVVVGCFATIRRKP
jgi:hypothetical protein